MTLYLTARWTLKTTYFWQQTFPAHREIVIEHRYKPSVGKALGGGEFATSLYSASADYQAKYKATYCLDPAFLAAASRAEQAVTAARADNSGYGKFLNAFWIDYILKTGATWAGPIADFTLTIDKGDPANLVSFCGDGVKKIAPTQFQVHYTNFTPKSDLAVLILTTNTDADRVQASATEPAKSAAPPVEHVLSPPRATEADAPLRAETAGDYADAGAVFAQAGSKPSAAADSAPRLPHTGLTAGGALAASPEADYLEARDKAIAEVKALENSKASQSAIDAAMDKALADLTKRLKDIVGPVSVKGFPGAGRLNSSTKLTEDVGYGNLDGVAYDDERPTSMNGRGSSSRPGRC